MTHSQAITASSNDTMTQLLTGVGLLLLLMATPVIADQGLNGIHVDSISIALYASNDAGFRFDNKKWPARATINGVATKTEQSVDGLVPEQRRHFANGSALVDWHSGVSKLRFTTGMVLTDNATGVVTLPREKFELGDRDLSSTEKTGQIYNLVRYSGMTPYAGVAWGFALNRRALINIDVGAAFQGKLSLRLAVDDNLPVDREFQEHRKEARRTIEEAQSESEIFPTARIGFTVRF